MYTNDLFSTKTKLDYDLERYGFCMIFVGLEWRILIMNQINTDLISDGGLFAHDLPIILEVACI